MIRRSLSTAGLVLGAVFFPTSPLRAQEAGPWALRLEGAVMRIHDDDTLPAGALRLSRALGSGGTSVEIGLTASSYVSADVSLEQRLCRSCRVAPFIGVGAGFMGEDGYTGLMVRGTAGIEAALGQDWFARVSGQFGRHDGQSGPHQLAIGFGRRFGRRR
jgi:hypothetical protein